MGKKNKARRNNKKKDNQTSEATQEEKEDDIRELEEAADMLGLTEEQKAKLREDQENPEKPHEEEDFESTEEKARNDMEQCEKLIGMHECKDKPYEERQQNIEAEKAKIKETLGDREHEEMKRVTKKNKKTLKEADDIMRDKRLDEDRKLKSMYDTVQKIAKQLIMVRETKFDQIIKVDKLEKDLDTKNRALDKTFSFKHTLHNLFQGLKEKNIESYRMKDDAIKEQQQAKKDMTKMFEQEIDKVTSSYQDQVNIKEQYELKKKELEKLAESRNVIEHREKRINDLQTDINSVIESELKGLMDKFNVEKGKYDKLSGEREQLNNQYKTLKDKFHKYLEEIETSDAKIKVYDSEVQTLQKKIKDVVEENNAINLEKDETLLKSSEDEDK
jgi:chromosome segregation ATPase